MATPPDGAAAPTIASDLADYAPGGTVTLTGAGWQAGEDATIVVNDTGGLSWSLNQKVVADAEGRLTLTFNLPNYYVPDYDVTVTGALSGVATTTFTDAADGWWQYWMTAPTPAAGNVTPGGTIVYTLNAQKRGTGVDVMGPVVTLTLAGNATFTGPTGALGDDLGTITRINAKTLWWSGMTLDRTSGTNTMRTITVLVTVDASAPAGLVIATAGDERDNYGDLYNGADRFGSTTHTVVAPTVGTCSFATPGSGAFAKSICWFDLSGYDATRAASVNGQSMQQELLNGYVLSYAIKATTTTNVIAHILPTYGAAYLGNNTFYQGIKGKPALYQQTNGSETTLALTGISLKDGDGNSVTGFALVGADAESSHSSEWITWTSDKIITSAVAIADRGNECGGGFTGIGTMSVTCTGDGSGAKTGAAILYSQDPGQFTQTMKGAGLQAVAFGVMVSGVQLNKRIINKLPGDQFSISVARADGTVAATAITDPVTGSAATEQVYVISSGASQTFTLSERPLGSALAANYATTWACTKNGASSTSTGTSVTAAVALNDFVECTITNTGPALTLKKTVDNTAGGVLTPENWTLTATRGSATAIATAPSPPLTTTGKVTTASTASVAVPAGDYTLGESSTATGAAWYAAGAWSCSKAGSGNVPLTGSTVRLAAGDDVTCTITNTYKLNVTVRTTWVNGLNADTTGLVINNAATAPGKATSTSNGNLGSWTDTGNVATATPAVGSTVSVAEVMQAANKGTYTSVLDCRNGAAVVPISGGAFTMPNGNVTCEYTNKLIVGTATWSMVDAGSTSTLLKGSEWILTGPSYPSPGITVADCTSLPCVGPDTNSLAGQFTAPVRYGTYTLVEKTAPIGFQVDATVRSFALATDGQVVGLGAFANKRSAVPALPLTGGASTESFLLAGLILIAAAGSAGWRQRRRLLRSQ